jgi:hypothetical protein
MKLYVSLKLFREAMPSQLHQEGQERGKKISYQDPGLGKKQNTAIPPPLSSRAKEKAANRDQGSEGFAATTITDATWLWET